MLLRILLYGGWKNVQLQQGLKIRLVAIAMNPYPEIEMLLYVALFATVILLVLYWLIRKAVKDGISDSLKHKSDSD